MRTTPSKLPNRESGPQNQPRAKVAVSVLIGAEVSTGGMAAFGVILLSLSVLRALSQPSRKAGNMETARSTDIRALIIIILFQMLSYSSILNGMGDLCMRLWSQGRLEQ